MSKGSRTRPSSVSKEEYDANYEAAFGTGKKKEPVPFWIGPYRRGEYQCPHGVGHGNHIHGCDGCCSRDDFPLNDKNIEATRKREREKDDYENRPCMYNCGAIVSRPANACAGCIQMARRRESEERK